MPKAKQHPARQNADAPSDDTELAMYLGPQRQKGERIFSPNERSIAALDAYLGKLYYEGALIGRNHDTLFLDVRRLDRVSTRRRHGSMLLLVCDELVGNRIGLLCARVYSELLEKELPKRNRKQRTHAAEYAANLAAFQKVFASVPALKGRPKRLLETEHQKLLALAHEVAGPNQIVLARDIRDRNRKRDASRKRDTRRQHKNSISKTTH